MIMLDFKEETLNFFVDNLLIYGGQRRRTRKMLRFPNWKLGGQVNP